MGIVAVEKQTCTREASTPSPPFIIIISAQGWRAWLA